jgi:hypothetical protein
MDPSISIEEVPTEEVHFLRMSSSINYYTALFAFPVLRIRIVREEREPQCDCLINRFLFGHGC